jgi:hypothetical protein
VTRRKVSPEDEARIGEVLDRYSAEWDGMLARHLAEMKDLRERKERELRQIPGYPAWAGWKAVHK